MVAAAAAAVVAATAVAAAAVAAVAAAAVAVAFCFVASSGPLVDPSKAAVAAAASASRVLNRVKYHLNISEVLSKHVIKSHVKHREVGQKLTSPYPISPCENPSSWWTGTVFRFDIL